MPKQAKEKTPAQIRALKHPGGDKPLRVAVGGVPGLLLHVSPAGAKSWVLRVRAGGRRREIGLGGFPRILPGEARDRAREALAALEQGRDPVTEKREAKARLAAEAARSLTLAAAVERYAAEKLGELRTQKYRDQWVAALQRHVLPVLGKLMVRDIGMSDVARVLRPIWTEVPETASRVRGRLEAIFDWAAVSGFSDGANPAKWKGALEHVLPKPGAVATVEHQPAVAVTEAAAWFADLCAAYGMAPRALAFAVLCAARSGEVRGATWDEIDTERAIWTVPAKRMKAGREHRVPLSPEAVALLDALPRLDGNPLVFQAARGGALSDMALSQVMRRLHAAKLDRDMKAGTPEDKAGWRDARSGRPAVPHGIRSTFRQWTAERGFPRDMAEMALAHFIGTEVERTYQRSDMIERRRQMMAAWADHLTGNVAGATVVSMVTRSLSTGRRSMPPRAGLRSAPGNPSLPGCSRITGRRGRRGPISN